MKSWKANLRNEKVANIDWRTKSAKKEKRGLARRSRLCQPHGAKQIIESRRKARRLVKRTENERSTKSTFLYHGIENGHGIEKELDIFPKKSKKTKSANFWVFREFPKIAQSFAIVLLVRKMAQALAPLTTGSCRHQGCFCGGSRTVPHELKKEATLCVCQHPLFEHNPLESGSLLFCPTIFPAFLLNLFSSFCFLILVCDFLSSFLL